MLWEDQHGNQANTLNMGAITTTVTKNKRAPMQSTAITSSVKQSKRVYLKREVNTDLGGSWCSMVCTGSIQLSSIAQLSVVASSHAMIVVLLYPTWTSTWKILMEKGVCAQARV